MEIDFLGMDNLLRCLLSFFDWCLKSVQRMCEAMSGHDRACSLFIREVENPSIDDKGLVSIVQGEKRQNNP